MELTKQEIGMGLVVATCTCCGNVYKTHGMVNACFYSTNPGFGCSKCQGIARGESNYERQRRGLK